MTGTLHRLANGIEHTMDFFDQVNLFGAQLYFAAGYARRIEKIIDQIRRASTDVEDRDIWSKA